VLLVKNVLVLLEGRDIKMPYIKQEDRDRINKSVDKDSMWAPVEVLLDRINCKGDLNYILTRLTHLWVLRNMNVNSGGKKSYEELSKGFDVLAEAAAEYQAAVMHPYEKKKTAENGPVSELDS
jgi:hypothetical protein